MLALLSADRPFARDHWDPGHFTASAFVLSPDSRRLALIFHGKLHRWLQPGGHLEEGDATVEAAARREVHEELGLSDLEVVGEGVLDLDIHDIPSLKGQPPHGHFDVRYLFRAATEDLLAGDDAAGAKWQTLDEVLAAPGDESVARAVRRVRAVVGA
jgi:8-oxo-dGTP pyrophosphatase MutT (NUDIX family)